MSGASRLLMCVSFLGLFAVVGCDDDTNPSDDDAGTDSEVPNACGEDDLAEIEDNEETFGLAASGCYGICIEEEDPSSCWTECLAAEFDLADTCLECLGGTAECVAEECQGECDSISSADCHACACENDCYTLDDCGVPFDPCEATDGG